MACRLLDTAQQRWRKFNCHGFIIDMFDGVKFTDGIEVTDDNNAVQNKMAAA
ncbi:MAG: hypothetical protein ACP5H2_01615 [Solirubrobacteraceae bacterium]